MATPIPPNRAQFRSEDAAHVTHGTLHATDPARIHVGITTDSRAVEPGGAFVALEGENHDGHDFLQKARERGATLLVVLRGRGPADLGERSIDVLEVDDTLVAWGELARAHLRAWRKPNTRRVIAITGSVGKTTTKELAAALLAATGARVRASDGNLNNRIGVPAVIFTLDDSFDVAVLECGMSLPGEMERLARIVEPDVAVVTNVGLAHAENVGGTQEGVAREKGALYRGIRLGGALVVNADDPLAMAQAAAVTSARRTTFGRDSSARVRLVDRAGRGFRGSELAIARAGAGEWSVGLPLLGEGAALDLVAAIAAVEAALDRTITSAELESALSALPPNPGRAHVRARFDGALIVDDTYNASPQSMRNALESLSEIARAEGRRAVCVLGEMRELGPDADALHEDLGDDVARAQVALLIGCGGRVKNAIAKASQRGVRCLDLPDAEAAAKVAATEVQPGDVVLVKGSRAVGTERVVSALLGGGNA
jgi:UDP-N-acetylmuramoyl-tripeptide--D-alanyl-D-alanine ligase